MSRDYLSTTGAVAPATEEIKRRQEMLAVRFVAASRGR